MAAKVPLAGTDFVELFAAVPGVDVVVVVLHSFDCSVRRKAHSTASFHLFCLLCPSTPVSLIGLHQTDLDDID